MLEKIKNYNDFKKLTLDEIKELPEEIRKLIIDVVSKNGGHLASSLGVVELTLALGYVFDFRKDKIVWDVGHQCYTYKIITDRKDKFHTLRQLNGIAGFPSIKESPFDYFGTGHSGTSISATTGFAIGRDLKEENRKLIAVIGDGSLTSGIALEGLNFAGHIDRDMIIILNDNEMSISKNVGALSKYLSKLMRAKLSLKLREDIKKTLTSIPAFGDSLLKIAKHAETTFKGFILPPGIIFEELGLTYIGPIDGHDIYELTETFENIKFLEKPIIVHVITKKGKGYDLAEENPEKFHGIGKFKIETGESLSKKNKLTFTQVFSKSIIKLAEKNEKIIGITAAMPSGTGLEDFGKKFPDRIIDVGICEQHGVTFAAGLSLEGFIPVVAIYSTFLQRAYDMIIHDVCLQNLHVVFAIDRAGIVGEDGATHHGLFDIAYLRHIPNMTIMLPKDENELQHMIYTAVEKIKTPVALRYPRGYGEGVKLDNKFKEIPVGKAEIIQEGNDLCIISAGAVFHEVKNVIKELDYSIELINLRFVKPLDKDLFLEKLPKFKKVIVIEEGIVQGGAGSAILEFCAKNDILDFEKFKIIGIDDKFVPHGKQNELRELNNLTADKIKKIIEEVVNGTG